MNYRDRDLLNLCYEFDCELHIEGVCEGGRGEPCHANWPEHGKGMGMKAHDCFVVPGCRACHNALDQGSKLSGEQRKDIWLRAYWRYVPKLWQRGLLLPGDMSDILRSKPQETRTVPDPYASKDHDAAKTAFAQDPRSRRKVSKRGTHCTRPSKLLPRNWNRETAEGQN